MIGRLGAGTGRLGLLRRRLGPLRPTPAYPRYRLRRLWMTAYAGGLGIFLSPLQGMPDFHSHSRGFAPGLVIFAPLGRRNWTQDLRSYRAGKIEMSETDAGGMLSSEGLTPKAKKGLTKN
jgi:hypothetical protein